MIPEDEIQDTDCVYEDEVYPEHDYGHSGECRRCGAEAEEDA